MISPLDRTRNYKTSNEVDAENFVPGLYNINDDNIPRSDIHINNILIDNNEKVLNRWSDLFYEICVLSYDTDKQRFNKICEDNIIHKRDYVYDEKRNRKSRKPCLSYDSNLLQNSRKVEDSNIFCECCFSQDKSLKYSRDLIKEMGLKNIIQLDLSI